MSGDVIALEVLFVLYLGFFAWLIWTTPAPREPGQVWTGDVLDDPFPGPLLTDPVDLELQRILDGGR